MRGTNPGPSLTFQTARLHRHRMEAFRLAYDRYLARGLILPNPYKVRVVPHHLLETSEVLIALDRGRVAATVGLARDGEHGLPMESAFPDIVVRLRRRRHRLAEAFGFAATPAAAGRSPAILTGLIRLLERRVLRQSIDVVLIAVHPRHLSFYRRRLGFTPMGPARNYPMVRDQPAVACLLNVRASALDGAFQRHDAPQPKMYPTERALLAHYCRHSSPIAPSSDLTPR